MENNEDFLRHWLEGNISTEELNSRRKKGDSTVTAYDELITRSSRLSVPDSTSKEEAWKKLSSRLTESKSERTRIIPLRTWTMMSIAASITLIAVVFFGFGPTTISTRLGETSVYVLPDNSTVTLNADSKLSFNRIKWFFNREVVLEGEAFFAVTKASDFTVSSEKGSVTVLGTTFNVLARSGTYEVSCFTGKVSVMAADESVILTKGLQTRLGESGLTKAQPFDTEKSTWREGDFYFESARLADVIDELERQFGVEIDFEGDSSRTYTGYFSNKNLDEALAMVFKPMSLNYTIQKDNKIVVK